MLEMSDNLLAYFFLWPNGLTRLEQHIKMSNLGVTYIMIAAATVMALYMNGFNLGGLGCFGHVMTSIGFLVTINP